jgi:hypothetical protein
LNGLPGARIEALNEAESLGFVIRFGQRLAIGANRLAHRQGMAFGAIDMDENPFSFTAIILPIEGGQHGCSFRKSGNRRKTGKKRRKSA